MRTDDPVQSATASKINERLEREARSRVVAARGMPAAETERRIRDLDREWDIERVLETNASVLALGGLLGGLLFNRRFLALPAVVMSFLLWHALRGWCPPVPLFRRMGIRTRREIESERHALKALRGDYGDVSRDPGQGLAAWIAANKA